MTQDPARRTPAARHISTLRCQLLGALALGWVLGGCEEHRAEAIGPSSQRTPSGQCDDAGVQCFPQQELDAYVADGGFPEATFSPEGCVDSATLRQAIAPACEYPVSPAARHDDTCCYYICSAGPGCGRPFVVAGEARVAEPHTGRDWLREDIWGDQPELDAGIGREWLRDALAEHASVAAFSAFNLSLLALGAPAELVRASAAATLDEVHHARACFELASHYAGRPLAPAPLDLNDLHIDTDLASAVERTFLDGCIGETAAALVARASFDGCDAPRARATLERIAEDEARHAELAWQFIAWAIQQGGPPIARVLRNALERAESAQQTADNCRASDPASPEWRCAGRLSGADRASLARLALRDIVRPLLEALLSQPPPPRRAEPPTATA